MHLTIFSRLLSLLIAVFTVLLIPSRTPAQPDLRGEYHLLAGVSFSNPDEWVPGVQRISIHLDQRFERGRFFVRTDIRNRFEASADSLEWMLPEAWLELYFTNSDLRIGRQVLQPGHSPFQAPVDRIQPVDLRNFLLEPDPQLRRGTVALAYSYYLGDSRFRLLLSPAPTPSLLPRPDSRWFVHIPVPAGIPVRVDAAENRRGIRHPQFALLWESGNIGPLELQAGVLYWTPSTPAYRKKIRIFSPGNPLPSPDILLTEQFTPGWIATAAFSLQLSTALTATAEAAWFRERAFDRIPKPLLSFDWNEPDLTLIPSITEIIATEADGFLSVHSAVETVIGVRYSGSLLTLGGQWSAQIIPDPHPDVIQDSIFHQLAATVRRDLFRQRLSSDLTIVYQPNGKDFWIRTGHSYDLMDNVNVSVGAHFFGGPLPQANYGHPSFGSYRSNSLIYAGIRFFF